MRAIALLLAGYTTVSLALDDIPENLSDWTEHGVVVPHGAPGEWDEKATFVEPVGVSQKDGTFYLFYRAGFEGCWDADDDIAHMSVGLATSTDGVNFTKHPGNPVLKPHDFVPVHSHEEGIREAAIRYVPEEEQWVGYFGVESPGGADSCPFMGSEAQCSCNVSVDASIYAATSPNGIDWTVEGMVDGVYNDEENYVDDFVYHDGTYHVWTHRAQGGQTHHASRGSDFMNLSPLGEIPALCWGWSHVNAFLHDDGDAVTLIYIPHGGCAGTDDLDVYSSRTHLSDMTRIENEQLLHDRPGERSNNIIKDTQNGLWRWYYSVYFGDEHGTIQSRTHPLDSGSVPRPPTDLEVTE